MVGATASSAGPSDGAMAPPGPAQAEAASPPEPASCAQPPRCAGRRLGGPRHPARSRRLALGDLAAPLAEATARAAAIRPGGLPGSSGRSEAKCRGLLC